MPFRIIKKAEKFSEKKLRGSLKHVKASPKAIKAAVSAVKKKLHDNMTTNEIRKIISGVLKKFDPRALKKYVKFRRK